jgi:ABC-type glycerol-3-phosphate transport system substrate-binding protein
MQIKKITKMSLVLSIIIVILLSGFGCRDKGSGDGGIIKLKMWGVFDNSNEIFPFIKAYQAKHPNVQIDYQKKMFSEYEIYY